MLRVSYGEDFRASPLADLNQGIAEGFGKLTNYIACYEAGDAIDSCNLPEEAATQTGGNADLGPEESQTMNLGLVWNITDNIDFSLDYWQLNTDGLIQSISSNELLQTRAKLFEAADATGMPRFDISLVYPGAAIALLPNGRIDHVTSPVINIGESEGEGIDIAINANFETEFGDFDLGLNVSKYLTYKYTFVDDGISVISEDQAGRHDVPDIHINMNFDYTLGAHSIHYFTNYTNAQTTWDYNGDDEKSGLYEIDAHMTHNLSYNYMTPWNSNVTLGVNNLTDEEPEFDKWGGFNGNLYDIRGPIYYASFSLSF